MRRSILAVTSELPWPLNTGGHLRTFHLLRTLARKNRVRLVVPWPGSDPGSEVGSDPGSDPEALRGHGIDVIRVAVGARTRVREGARALRAAVSGRPYVFYHRHDWHAVRLELERQARIERPDVLYLDHLDSFVYRSALPDTPAVGDLHNVYSTLAARAAIEQRFWPMRTYLTREARLLLDRERDAAATSDALLVTSDEDRCFFESLGGPDVTLVPNGVDCAAYADLPVGRLSDAVNILYLGAMSWAPNAAAACFLARDVMPRIRAVRSDVRLQIVGRGAPREVQQLAQCDGVDVLGEVPSVRPHLLNATVLAVPLEAGGGTRLKIVEAFAAGLPVVSTAIGCEGLRVIHDQHLLIASRAMFVDALLETLRNRSAAADRAERARTLVCRSYDWGAIGEAACAAVERVCCDRIDRGSSRSPIPS